MEEPLLLANALSGAWQLAQLVPAGSESLGSKKMALPNAMREGLTGDLGPGGSPWLAASPTTFDWEKQRGSAAAHKRLSTGSIFATPCLKRRFSGETRCSSMTSLSRQTYKS